MIKSLNIKITIFFCVTFLWTSQLGNIKNYKFIDGLSSNNVTEIALDGKNRTWIGTYNGISMFNGNEFQNFYNEESISEKYINCAEANEYGNWFGTNDALLKMIESEEGIQIQKYLEFPNGVSDIALIGSRIYAVSKNKLYSIHSTSKQSKEIDFRNIKKLVPFGKKLIVTTNSKIYSYDIATENKKILKNMDSDIISISIKNSELFVGSNNGLYKFSLINSKMNLEKHFFKNKTIEAIEFSEHELFISVNNSIYKLTENSPKNLNLSLEKVKSLQFTKENILFVGSFGDGLYQIDPYSFNNYSKFSGKNNVRINSSVQFKDDIFFVTEEGFYSKKKDKFLLKGNIFDIYLERDKKIWLATQNGIYTYSNNEINKIKLEGTQANVTVLSIKIDKMGVKWFGTTKGLIKYNDRKSDNIVFLYNSADGLISNIIGVFSKRGCSSTIYVLKMFL